MGYNFLNFDSPIDDIADLKGAGAERRGARRMVTVYRVAHVLASGDHGLARVLNISDPGLMLSTKLDLMLGDEIAIDLSEACSLTGYAVWRAADRCGVKLKEPIDATALLKRLREEQKAHGARHLRVAVDKRIIVTSELGIQIARLRDISQRGAKLVHDGRFYPGLAVKIQIAPHVERRGIVRWSLDGIAGIELMELFSVEELGSINYLTMRR